MDFFNFNTNSLSDFFNWYHNNGVLPNLWKGFTGQLSNEKIADDQMKFEDKKFNEEMAWQRENFATQMDFANRQLGEQTRIADQNFALQQQSQSWNQNMQQSAFDYQKQLNATQMQREDTALQRQMADARAAGLSPLSVVGGSGASSSPLSTASPSDVSSAQYDGSGIASASRDYLALANQYAQLHMQAYGQHVSGARAVAMQKASLAQGSRAALQSLARNLFDSGINAKNAAVSRKFTEAQTERLHIENEYYNTHGYRPVTTATVLSDFLNSKSGKEFLNSANKLASTVADIGSKGIEKLDKAVNTVVDKLSNAFSGSEKPNYGEVYKEFKTQGLSDESAKIMADNVQSIYDEYNSLPWYKKVGVSWKSFFAASWLKLKDKIKD